MKDENLKDDLTSKDKNLNKSKIEKDEIIKDMNKESLKEDDDNTIDSNENDEKEEDMKERKELYDAFKKETLKDKIINFFIITDEKKEDYINNSNTFSKHCINGFIVGILLSILFSNMLSIRRWISPLENIDDVNKKLNEINYIINKTSLYEKDPEKVEDMISLGMMASLGDKYATYYNKSDLESIMQGIEGEYVGIGVMVLDDSSSNGLIITTVYEGSPAHEKGMKVGERIIKVDGKDTLALEIEEVVALVKGVAGTTVEITTLTNDKVEKNYTVTRRKVEVPEVTGKMLEKGIGYAKINQFEGKAYKQFIELQDEFIDNNIKGLIIDLRDNTGGSLDVLESLANVFIDNDVITYFEDKNGKKEIFRTLSGKWDIPVVILINGYSASASEAFAGALQDYGIATLVGTETYGKGLVQDIHSLSDGTAIKLTVAKYFTPKGRNFDGEGIKPDIEIEPLKDENGNELIDAEDVQLNKAIEVMLEKLNK